MAITLNYKSWKVEVLDSLHAPHGTKNAMSSHNLIHLDGTEHYPRDLQFIIKVMSGSHTEKTAVLAHGLRTGLYADSCLVDDGNLVLRCGNKIFECYHS